MSDGQFVEGRLQYNKHFASHLRRRLTARHENGTAARETIDRMSDEDLIAVYFRNEQLGKDHAAKRRAEKDNL